MEAPPGFEPGMEVLQTSALPLGDGAGRTSIVQGNPAASFRRGDNSEQARATRRSSATAPRITTRAAGTEPTAKRRRVDHVARSCLPHDDARPSERSGASGEARAERSEPGGVQGPPPIQNWSGKRDSNPRLRPWQGRTLPLRYSRSSTTWRAPHNPP